MAKVQKQTGDQGLTILKKQLRSKQPGNFYVFWGEEAYLREVYLAQLRTLLLGDSDFDHHRFQGQDPDISGVLSALQTPPFLADSTLVELWDFDPFKAREEVRQTIQECIDSLASDCCLVFVFTQGEYKPDGRMKKLAAAMAKAQVVQFTQPGESELCEWIHRHFQTCGKEISRADCQYLSFLTGGDMTVLNQEIEKVSAYTKSDQVSREDIDAVVTPILEAGAFDMVDQVSRGAFDQALVKLRQLYELGQEPIPILAALSFQMRRMYAARLLLDSGKGAGAIQERFHIREYPARLLLESARRFSTAWCAGALILLARTDHQLKTSYDDPQRLVELLLLELAREARP